MATPPNTPALDLAQFDGRVSRGPWTASEPYKGSVEILSAEYALVATTHASGGDAALIAAAPDLLAECVRLRRELSEASEAKAELWEALRRVYIQPVGHTDRDTAKDMAAMCRIARAALEARPNE